MKKKINLFQRHDLLKYLKFSKCSFRFVPSPSVDLENQKYLKKIKEKNNNSHKRAARRSSLGLTTVYWENTRLYKC